MNLAGLRYWQWIVIGLALGSLIGWAWMGPPTELPRTGDPTDFSYAVLSAKEMQAQGKPIPLTDITVFPPETDPSGNSVYAMTYQIMSRDRRTNAVTKQSWLINAKTPYLDAVTRKEYPTVMDYLTRNEIPFANRAGNTRYVPVGYGAAAGVLLIGLAWPATIQLLVKAGLATPPPPREKKVKQPKGSSKTTVENYGTDKAGNRGMTGADVGSLNALNDDMEKSLAAGLTSGEGRSAAAVAAGEPVSIFMNGGGTSSPAEAVVAVPSEPERPKDYKGDYYPVARPIVKKDGEA